MIKLMYDDFLFSRSLNALLMDSPTLNFNFRQNIFILRVFRHRIFHFRISSFSSRSISESISSNEILTCENKPMLPNRCLSTAFSGLAKREVWASLRIYSQKRVFQHTCSLKHTLFGHPRSFKLKASTFWPFFSTQIVRVKNAKISTKSKKVKTNLDISIENFKT